MNPNRGALLKPSERNGAGTRSISRHRNGSRYEVLKDKIRTWWNDRLKIGEALKEIRDEKLYKAEYSSFEDFCTDEFNLKHSQVYGLIAAVGVKESVAKVSAIAEEIKNEGQARALAKIPEPKRVEVLEEVAATGPVTAKRITETAQKNGHKAKPDKPAARLDKTGYPIPEGILELWDRAEAFKETINQVSKIKVLIEKGLADHEEIFSGLSNAAVAHAKNLYTELKQVLPYAVCTSCEGHHRKKCSLCKGRGFLGEFIFSTAVPAEIKKIRSAKCS